MAVILSETERTITLGYSTFSDADAHLQGIFSLMCSNPNLLAVFVPFQFTGDRKKPYARGTFDLDLLGIRVIKCKRHSFGAHENTLGVIIDDQVPSFIKADYLFTGDPHLVMLKGIPLDKLTASRGSVVAHTAFGQLRDIVEEVAQHDIITSDLKPANAIYTEITEKDCEMWADGYKLEPGQQRVFLIDGGQLVENKGRIGGVVSLFRELDKSSIKTRSKFMSDRVGRALVDQARETLQGRAPHATALLNPLHLVECALYLMAIQLGVAYTCNTEILDLGEKPLKFWIGGEGL